MKTIALDIANPADGAADVIAAAHSFLQPGDHLVLFHSLYHRALDAQTQQDGIEVLTDARASLIAARERELHSIARQLDAHVDDCQVAWTDNGWQALIEFAAEASANLIIARSARSATWRPLAKANADWQLIRHSNVPLLLTRRTSRDGYRCVMAAVDPLHLDDKPAELDHRILAHADRVAREHDAALCVVNVVTPAVPPISVAGAAPALAIGETNAPRLDAHRQRLDELVRDSACAASSVCVLTGSPADEIVRHCDEHKADLVVMGAVSRSALRNALIGNTAEKVLGKLDADTLIIKPGGAPRPAS